MKHRATCTVTFMSEHLLSSNGQWKIP